MRSIDTSGGLMGLMTGRIGFMLLAVALATAWSVASEQAAAREPARSAQQELVAVRSSRSSAGQERALRARWPGRASGRYTFRSGRADLWSTVASADQWTMPGRRRLFAC